MHTKIEFKKYVHPKLKTPQKQAEDLLFNFLTLHHKLLNIYLASKWTLCTHKRVLCTLKISCISNKLRVPSKLGLNTMKTADLLIYMLVGFILYKTNCTCRPQIYPSLATVCRLLVHSLNLQKNGSNIYIYIIYYENTILKFWNIYFIRTICFCLYKTDALEIFKLYFHNKLFKSPSNGLNGKCLSLNKNLIFSK